MRQISFDDFVELHRLYRGYASNREYDGVRSLAWAEVLAVLHPRLRALVYLAGFPDMPEIVAAPVMTLVVLFHLDPLDLLLQRPAPLSHEAFDRALGICDPEKDEAVGH